MPIIGLFFETDRCSINEMKPTLDKVEVTMKEINGVKSGLIIAANWDILKLMMEKE